MAGDKFNGVKGNSEKKGVGMSKSRTDTNGIRL
jgi:hypothetical protein